MFHYLTLNFLMMHCSMLRYLMFQYLILCCLMLHYLLLHYLRLHCFNVILFRISVLMLHNFNVLVFDVALFEFALFIGLFTDPIQYCFMLQYLNVALFISEYISIFEYLHNDCRSMTASLTLYFTKKTWVPFSYASHLSLIYINILLLFE